jgi:hypothetical protein
MDVQGIQGGCRHAAGLKNSRSTPDPHIFSRKSREMRGSGRFEKFLFRPAFGTDPVVRKVFKRCSRSNAAVGVPDFGIIHITARTLILFHHILLIFFFIAKPPGEGENRLCSPKGSIRHKKNNRRGSLIFKAYYQIFPACERIIIFCCNFFGTRLMRQKSWFSDKVFYPHNQNPKNRTTTARISVFRKPACSFI